MLAQIERRKLIPVLLVDGPCAGRHEHVAVFGDECWVRVGKPGSQTADSQAWVRYDHNPLKRGEYVYSGLGMTTSEFQEALRAHKAAGHTYGEGYGA